MNTLKNIKTWYLSEDKAPSYISTEQNGSKSLQRADLRRTAEFGKTYDEVQALVEEAQELTDNGIKINRSCVLPEWLLCIDYNAVDDMTTGLKKGKNPFLQYRDPRELLPFDTYVERSLNNGYHQLVKIDISEMLPLLAKVNARSTKNNCNIKIGYQKTSSLVITGDTIDGNDTISEPADYEALKKLLIQIFGFNVAMSSSQTQMQPVDFVLNPTALQPTFDELMYTTYTPYEAVEFLIRNNCVTSPEHAKTLQELYVDAAYNCNDDLSAVEFKLLTSLAESVHNTDLVCYLYKMSKLYTERLLTHPERNAKDFENTIRYSIVSKIMPMINSTKSDVQNTVRANNKNLRIQLNKEVALINEEAKFAKQQSDEDAKAAKQQADEDAKAAKQQADEKAKVAKQQADEKAKVAKLQADEKAKAAKQQVDEKAKVAKLQADEKAKAAKQQVEDKYESAKDAYEYAGRLVTNRIRQPILNYTAVQKNSIVSSVLRSLHITTANIVSMKDKTIEPKYVLPIDYKYCFEDSTVDFKHYNDKFIYAKREELAKAVVNIIETSALNVENHSKDTFTSVPMHVVTSSLDVYRPPLEDANFAKDALVLENKYARMWYDVVTDKDLMFYKLLNLNDANTLVNIILKTLGDVESKKFLLWALSAVQRFDCIDDTPPKSLCLYGPQGTGKSTFVNILSGDGGVFKCQNKATFLSINSDQIGKAASACHIVVSDETTFNTADEWNKYKDIVTQVTAQIRTYYTQSMQQCHIRRSVITITNEEKWIYNIEGSRRCIQLNIRQLTADDFPPEARVDAYIDDLNVTSQYNPYTIYNILSLRFDESYKDYIAKIDDYRQHYDNYISSKNDYLAALFWNGIKRYFEINNIKSAADIDCDGKIAKIIADELADACIINNNANVRMSFVLEHLLNDKQMTYFNISFDEASNIYKTQSGLNTAFLSHDDFNTFINTYNIKLINNRPLAAIKPLLNKVKNTNALITESDIVKIIGDLYNLIDKTELRRNNIFDRLASNPEVIVMPASTFSRITQFVHYKNVMDSILNSEYANMAKFVKNVKLASNPDVADTRRLIAVYPPATTAVVHNPIDNVETFLDVVAEL